MPKIFMHYRKHPGNSDRNNSKILAVCDSHKDTDQWARNNMPKSKKLEKILNRCKFNNYLWNYGRLSGGPKQEFAAAFRLEFLPIWKKGLMDFSALDSGEYATLKKILYPDSSWAKIWYHLVRISRLFVKSQTRNGYKKIKILSGLITVCKIPV